MADFLTQIRDKYPDYQEWDDDVLIEGLRNRFNKKNNQSLSSDEYQIAIGYKSDPSKPQVKTDGSAYPEVSSHDPSIVQRIQQLGSSDSDRARAMNEVAAIGVAQREQMPTGEVYEQAGFDRPQLNPEGRSTGQAVTEGVGIVAGQIPDVPQGVVNTVLKAIKGDKTSVDDNWLDDAINYTEVADPKNTDPNYQPLYGIGKSLGYSLVTMAASIAANSVSGPVGGMLASGAVAYRISKADFVSRTKNMLDDKSMKLYGRPLNQEEWDNAYSEMESVAVKDGLWEAIPEAIGNMVMLRALTAPLKGASMEAAAEVAKRAATTMASEQVTETATGVGQSHAEEEVGLGEGKTVAEAFKEQAIPTAIVTGLMGGAGGGMKAGTNEARKQYLVAEEKRDPKKALGREMLRQSEGQTINQAIANIKQLPPEDKSIVEMVQEKAFDKGLFIDSTMNIKYSAEQQWIPKVTLENEKFGIDKTPEATSVNNHRATSEEVHQGMSVGNTEIPTPPESVGVSEWTGESAGDDIVNLGGRSFDLNDVWHHGSNEDDMTHVTPGYDEPGAWFTKSRQYASQYGENVYDFHLSAKNTAVISFNSDMEPILNGEVLEFDNNIDIVEFAERKRYDSVYFPDGNFTEDSETFVVFDKDMAVLADAAKKLPTPQSELPTPKQKKKTPDERFRESSQVDTDNDSLLVAAAKSGGLNMSEWLSEGVDEAYFTDKGINNKIFGRPLFRRNGGMTADDLAEIANELGYGANLSANDALDLVMQELGGDAVLTGGGRDRQALEDARVHEEDIQAADESWLASDYNQDEFESLTRGMSPEQEIAFHAAVSSNLEPLNYADDYNQIYNTAVKQGLLNRETEKNDRSQGLAGEGGASEKSDTKAQDKKPAPEKEESGTEERPALEVATSINTGFELARETESERRDREAKESDRLKSKEKAEKLQDERDQADKELDGFSLSGSDREADIATGKGQGDLLDKPSQAKALTAMPDTAHDGIVTYKPKAITGDLFREASVESLSSLLREVLSNSVEQGSTSPIFIADNKDIALGQGKNKGVIIELDGDLVSGDVVDKPGMIEGITSKEYKTDFVGRDAIKRFIIPKGKGITGVGRVMANQHFNVKKNDDGSRTYTRKDLVDNGPETLSSATARKSGAGGPGDLHIELLAAKDLPAKEPGTVINLGDGSRLKITKKPVSTRKIRQLVRKLSPALLYYGKSVKVRGTTKGIYNLRGEFIQTAEKETSEAMEILSHEIFHWLDERGVKNKDIAYGGKLNDFSKNQASGYTYNKNAPVQEDGAEFFRVYMTDYPTLKQQSPQEVLALEAILKTNKSLYKKIKGIQKAVHAHLHQPVASRGASYEAKEMGFVQRQIMEGGVRKLFNQIWDNRTGALDAAKGVNNEQAIIDLTNLPHHIYSFATKTINQGVPRFDDGQIVFDDKTKDGKDANTKGFAKAVDDLGKDKAEKLFHFLDGRRAATLKGEGREKLFSPDVIKLYLSYGKDNSIADVAKHYDRLMKGLLDFAVDEGGLSRETADSFGPNYVNFGRVIDHISPTEGGGAKDPYKRLQGGTQSLKEFEERFMSSIIGNLTAGINGRIKRALYSNPNGEYFAKWDKQQEPVSVAIEQAIEIVKSLHKQGVSILGEKFLDPMGFIDDEALTELFENSPSLLTSFVAVDPTNTEYDIDSWIDKKGEEHFVATEKGGIFAVSMANIGKMNRTAIGRFVAPLKSMYSHYAIMAMPYIQIPNLLSDYINYPVLSREIKTHQILSAYLGVGAMTVRAIANTKSVQEYSKMGIFDTTMNSKIFDHLNLSPKFHVETKGTFGPERLLMRLSSVTKMLEYERAIKNGKTKGEAAYSANRMVAEWGMRGTNVYINTFFDVFPFARSVSNSVLREAQRFKEDDSGVGKASAKAVARQLFILNVRGGLTLGAFGMLVYLYMLDDPERKKAWDESTPEQRMRSVYIAMTGDDDYTVMANKVKIPFLYGSMFMGAAWSMMDAIRDVEGRKPLNEFVIRIARNFTMPVELPIISPLVQVGLNTNFYNWSPIEREWMRRLPIESRRGSFTPEFIQSDSESLFSAKQKEFLYRRAGAAIGSMAMDVVSSEMWDYENYGDRPFSIYRPDNREGGLYHLAMGKAYENLLNTRSTVFTVALDELVKEVAKTTADVDKQIREYKYKGNIDTKQAMILSENRKINREVNNFAKQFSTKEYENASDAQVVVRGMHLHKTTFNASRRVTFGNTKYYDHAVDDAITIEMALREYGGKKITTTYGSTKIPSSFSEYSKTHKQGATKEAVIWALQRYKNEQIRKLMQSRKVKQAGD